MTSKNRMQKKKKKQFWGKIWEPKEHNIYIELISNMKKEVQELEKGPEVNILFDSERATLRKVANWKTQGHDSIPGF